MDTSDKFWVIFVSAMALVVVVMVYTAFHSLLVTDMQPHEEVYYVIGYTKSYFSPTGTPITSVVTSYRVIGIDSKDNPIVETRARTYGGHYDFEIGRLYKVHSEGKPGWAYRKITMFETMDHDMP